MDHKTETGPGDVIPDDVISLSHSTPIKSVVLSLDFA